MTIYAIITEDGIDQLCDTLEQAKVEKHDLIEMGCTVRIKKFDNDAAAYDYEETKLWPKMYGK